MAFVKKLKQEGISISLKRCAKRSSPRTDPAGREIAVIHTFKLEMPVVENDRFKVALVYSSSGRSNSSEFILFSR